MNYRYEQRTLGTKTAPLLLPGLRIDDTCRQVKLRYRYSSCYSSSPRPALRTGWIRPVQHRFRDYQCIGYRQRDSDLAPLRLLLAEVKASEIRLGIKSYFNQSGTSSRGGAQTLQCGRYHIIIA